MNAGGVVDRMHGELAAQARFIEITMVIGQPQSRAKEDLFIMLARCLLTGVRYSQRSSDWPPVRAGRSASRARHGPRRRPPMLSISRPRPAQVAAAISGAALTAALVIAPGGSPGALAAAGAAPGAPGTASDWVPG